MLEGREKKFYLLGKFNKRRILYCKFVCNFEDEAVERMEKQNRASFNVLSSVYY